jgi:hypothetical protein
MSMARSTHPVLKALKRWERKGLLDTELVKTLEDEVRADAQHEGRQWSQYLLAATGGAVLVVAGGTFLAWAWPEMGAAGQSVTLAAIGFAIMVLGMRLPERGRWVAVAFLLQVAGAVLVLMALIHSEEAWADGTLGGWGAGLLALLLPIGLFLKSVKEHGVLAGVQAALGFSFLFVFLDRAFALNEDPILWILDGVMVLGLAILAFRLRSPQVSHWVLSVFFALLLSSIVLIVASAGILWDLEAETIFPMDLWLFIVAGIAFWGLQESTPAHLQREWYEPLLALCVLVGIPFAFISTLEALDTGPTPAALSVAAVGGLGLWFALPRGSKTVLLASCIALLIAAWYWGVEMSGALGAVGALVVVSTIFFWGSSQMGKGIFAAGGDGGTVE